jgi:hypothetical protein
MFDVTTIQPFSAIIAAGITASVSLVIAYFVVLKRKKIEVRVAPTEDLTLALRGHNRVIVVAVDGQPFLTLNRSTVSVRNTGNSNIEKLSLRIEIPGEHKGYLHDVIAENRELYDAISVSSESSSHNPTLDVSVGTFFNPGEEFWIVVFFDQEAARCNIKCRVPDTKVTIKHGSPLFDYRHAGWMARTAMIFMVTFVAVQGVFLIGLLGVLLYAFFFKVLAVWHFLTSLQ